jgi:hypothetical protein
LLFDPVEHALGHEKQLVAPVLTTLLGLQKGLQARNQKHGQERDPQRNQQAIA